MFTTAFVESMQSSSNNCNNSFPLQNSMQPSAPQPFVPSTVGVKTNAIPNVNYSSPYGDVSYGLVPFETIMIDPDRRNSNASNAEMFPRPANNVFISLENSSSLNSLSFADGSSIVYAGGGHVQHPVTTMLTQKLPCSMPVGNFVSSLPKPMHHHAHMRSENGNANPSQQLGLRSASLISSDSSTGNALNRAPAVAAVAAEEAKYDMEPYDSTSFANCHVGSLDSVLCMEHKKYRSAQNMVMLRNKLTGEVSWHCKSSSSCKVRTGERRAANAEPIPANQNPNSTPNANPNPSVCNAAPQWPPGTVGYTLIPVEQSAATSNAFYMSSIPVPAPPNHSSPFTVYRTRMQ